MTAGPEPRDDPEAGTAPLLSVIVPTRGDEDRLPTLLDALVAEDVYLAGSMLMVLSLLGVVGTLVSDLLLLWLDPRIRLEAGTR